LYYREKSGIIDIMHGDIDKYPLFE